MGLTKVQTDMLQGGDNLVLNGALDFWQRVESSTTTITSSSVSDYTADMIKYSVSGSTSKNFSIVNNSDSPNPAQSGFSGSNAYLFTMLTGLGSLATTDAIAPLVYLIDGYTAMNLVGRTRSFSFWFKPSITGTYSISCQNISANRSIVSTFTATGGVWQFIKWTIPFESGVSYGSGASASYAIYVASVCGSNQSTSTLNVWQSGNLLAATGATNWCATSNNTISVTQIALPNSIYGYSANGFQRYGQSYEEEFLAVQQYYYKTYDPGFLPGAITTNGCSGVVGSVANAFCVINLPICMAAQPTVTFYSEATGASGKCRDLAGSDATIGFGLSGRKSILGTIAATNGHQYLVHLTAEAGL